MVWVSCDGLFCLMYFEGCVCFVSLSSFSDDAIDPKIVVPKNMCKDIFSSPSMLLIL